MKLKQKLTDRLSVALFMVLGWAYLFFAVPYQIGFKEQTAAFIMQPGLLAGYFSKPAALALLAGDFLTQFFYFKALAPILAILCLLLLWFSLKLAMDKCRPARSNAVAALLPVAVELGFLVSLNYPLGATFGMIIAALIFAAVASVSMDKLRNVLFFAISPLVFVLAGGHLITYLVFCVWFLASNKKWITGIVLTVFAVVCMLLMGRWYNLSVLNTLITPAVTGYVTPKPILYALPPVMVLAALFISGAWLNIVTFIALFIAAFFSFNRTREFNVELETRAYKGQWEQLKQRTIENDGQTAMAIFYRNLCFAREGQMAENLMKYAQIPQGGLSYEVKPGVDYLSIFADIDMFIEVGDISQATDCALLCQTIMPSNNSARTLRSLAEIAMITGDNAVSEKYLDMLAATTVHRKWALEMKDSISAGTLPENIKIYRARTAVFDMLYHQNDITESLDYLLATNPFNKNASDYLLCSYLLGKKVNSFIGVYEKYWLNSLDQIYPVPEVYQQALLVNVTDEQSYIDAVSKYGISEDVQRMYFDFMGLTNQEGSERYVSKTPIEQLKKTYWNYIMSTSISQEK